MNLAWTPEELAFQEEVRRFFAENLTPEIRRAGSLMTSVYADHDLGLEWQRVLAARGWAAPAWPVEHGGCGWTVGQHYMFARERVRAGAPPVSPMGLNMVAHMIVRFGTPEQKAYFLPKTLSGEIFWCQGYSEPEAGSDLAALRMSAVDDGDAFVCNGVKVWTTHANVANWIFCLVRTSSDGKPQQGITFLLIDMRTPGVAVKPILMISGEHIQNQVFFTDVRVPKANVLGEVGQGWTVAKHLLEFERGGSAYGPQLRARLEGIVQSARASGLLEDTHFAARLARATMDVETVEAFEFRLLSAAAGGGVGQLASAMKVMGTELSQHLTELALDAAGPYAAPFQPHAAVPGGPTPDHTPPDDGAVVGEPWQAIAPLRYINERVGSIYAGSNEIQRNILAKAVLGL